MLTIRSDVSVGGLSGRQITDFLLVPSDLRYQRWWPGTHLRFHVVRRGAADHRGDVVLMDEFVGRRRIRLPGVVAEAVPGRRIVWRLGSRRLPLPIRLILDLSDRPGGVDIHHRIEAGFAGLGRLLDPLLRLYFNGHFSAAMDAHVQVEFHRLRDLLAPTPA